MAGIIAKAFRGAADTAQPMLMEQHRANVMEQRDKRIAELRERNASKERDYRTSERVADQDFRSGEGQKDRESRERIAGMRSGSKQTNKAPYYEKYFSDRADKQFSNETLSGVSFEGNNKYHASKVSSRAAEIFKAMPGDEQGSDSGLNSAWNQALQEFKGDQETEQKRTDAISQATDEAEDRGGLFGEGYGGKTKEQWANDRANEIVGGIINQAINPVRPTEQSGSPAGPNQMDTDTPPTPGARKAKDGKWYVNQNGKWYMVN